MPLFVSADALADSREAMLAGVIDSRPYHGDHAPMKALGVSAIFGPGSSADDLAKFLRENVRKQRVSFE